MVNMAGRLYFSWNGSAFDTDPNLARANVAQARICGTCRTGYRVSLMQASMLMDRDGPDAADQEIRMPEDARGCWKAYFRTQGKSPSQLKAVLEQGAEGLLKATDHDVYGKIATIPRQCMLPGSRASDGDGSIVVFRQDERLMTALAGWAAGMGLDFEYSNGCRLYFGPLLGYEYERLPASVRAVAAGREAVDTAFMALDQDIADVFARKP